MTHGKKFKRKNGEAHLTLSTRGMLLIMADKVKELHGVSSHAERKRVEDSEVARPDEEQVEQGE